MLSGAEPDHQGRACRTSGRQGGVLLLRIADAPTGCRSSSPPSAFASSTRDRSKAGQCRCRSLPDALKETRAVDTRRADLMIEDFVRLVLSPFRDQNSSGTSDPSGLISLDAASAKTPANRPDSALIAIIASGPTRTARRTPRSFARDSDHCKRADADGRAHAAFLRALTAPLRNSMAHGGGRHPTTNVPGDFCG